MSVVSVIMPAYNAEKTIGAAIESVLQQSFKDFELIIIDDCSSDGTFEIMQQYAEVDRRIRICRNKINSGVSFTRNYGTEIAEGEWIAYLDSDDMWKSEKLEKQLSVIDNYPQASLIYTASSFISDDGVEYSYVMEAEEKTSYCTLLKRNLLSCSSVLIKADIVKNIKMPGDHMHEDYYTWLMALKKVKYAYGINEPLLIYRLSSNSKSSNRIKSAKMIYQTYKAIGYSQVLSFILMLNYSLHSIKKRYKIKNG